jgi:hypothetical protein
MLCSAPAPLLVVLFTGLGAWWALPLLMVLLIAMILVGTLRLPFNAASPAGRLPGRFWLYAAPVLLYGVAETLSGNWATLYLSSERGVPAQEAAFALTGFWVMVTLGHLAIAVLDRFIPARWLYLESIRMSRGDRRWARREAVIWPDEKTSDALPPGHPRDPDALLIRTNLDAVGGTGDTSLTASTDGSPGLRGILAAAGVPEPPTLDWFHIAMRLQHLKQIGDGRAANDSARAAAKAVIVTEVERLHWRIWNGKAKHARKSIACIRAVMHHFRGERDSRKSIAPSRKLWTALRALNGYLIGQSAWLVNYAERHRAGLRVGTAITEGTANFLVNRRLNKSQQMRWSRRGADLLLQVRCAVYNGTLGAEFGQKFHPANDSFPPTAVAACPPVFHRSR